MKIPNIIGGYSQFTLSLARIVSEDSQRSPPSKSLALKSSKDS